MSVSVVARSGYRNRLLRELPDIERTALEPHLEPRRFQIGTVLSVAGAPVREAFFPETFIASLIALPEREHVEAVSIGSEGFVGFPLLLGGTSISQTIVQASGDGYRLPGAKLEQFAGELPVFRSALLRYVMSAIDEIALTAACNRAHTLEERCAKWLLLVHDRGTAREFVMTHRFLATMLGVRRAGVTVAAGALQRAGMISYSRGSVTILDRDALERAACDCYPRIRRLQRTHSSTSVTSPPPRRQLTLV